MGLSRFSPISGTMQVRFFGWGAGLLSLVDRQCRSWELLTAFVFLWQDLFVHQQKNFHFSLYMVLEQRTPQTVSDPVVIAQVSQMRGAGSNLVVHSFSTCFGVVNLNFFHPKLLCDPSPLPSGYPAGGWVGLRVGGWVGQNPGRANLNPPPPVSLSKGLAGRVGSRPGARVTWAPAVLWVPHPN